MTAVFECIACRKELLTVGAEEARCGACGTHFSVEHGVPLLVKDWQAHHERLAKLAQNRPDWYQEEQPVADVSPWRHHLAKRRAYVKKAIEAHLKAKGRQKAPVLLDLGCGDGTNLSWLAPYGEQVFGSDYNPERLIRAGQKKTGATLFLADILDYPLPENAVDVVFFNHVLEHIPNDGAALATVKRILKPGGLLVLGIPNEGAPWWQLAYKRNPQSLETTDHVHFYTMETVSAKVERAGLSISQKHELGWGPPDWGWDMRLRQFKLLDDLFDAAGRIFLPGRAASLYILATKA